MKHKISILLGIVAIGAVFALGFIISNQQTFAANLCGSGFCESNLPTYGGYYGSYPYYSGFGFHHFHGGFGFHHFHGGFAFHRH